MIAKVRNIHLNGNSYFGKESSDYTSTMNSVLLNTYYILEVQILTGLLLEGLT